MESLPRAHYRSSPLNLGKRLTITGPLRHHNTIITHEQIPLVSNLGTVVNHYRPVAPPEFHKIRWHQKHKRKYPPWLLASLFSSKERQFFSQQRSPSLKEIFGDLLARPFRSEGGGVMRGEEIFHVLCRLHQRLE